MGQRRKVKPGDRDHRAGWLGEVWIEWGEGEVLADALPAGRRQRIFTRPTDAGQRNGLIVLKPEHLESPMGLAVDTHDRSLPAFVRGDPSCLIGHRLGYRSVVRRTQAYVQDTPGGLDVPIDKVPGMNFDTRSRYKVRELLEVVEIDERDPAQFAAPVTSSPVVESDPSTWPERDGEASAALALKAAWQREQTREERGLDRQHASFGLVPAPVPNSAKVQALRVADRSLKAILDRAAPEHYREEHFVAWRSLVFSIVERVLRQIEGDFEQPTEAFLAACDLTEGALLLYSRSWPFPLTDERILEYERLLTDTATSAYGQVSGWRIH